MIQDENVVGVSIEGAYLARSYLLGQMNSTYLMLLACQSNEKLDLLPIMSYRKLLFRNKKIWFVIALTKYLFDIQVKYKIHSINGQSTSTMTNKQIQTALIKPNAEIIVIPSDLKRKQKLCLRANGISAKKKKHNITVLESTHVRIPIGWVILYINGIYSDYLDTLKVSDALLFPNCNIIYETDIINQFLDANFIYASRKGKSKELIVTHSTKSGIPIRTVVIKIDSILVDQLSNDIS